MHTHGGGERDGLENSGNQNFASLTRNSMKKLVVNAKI